MQPFKVKLQMHTSEGNGVDGSIAVTAQAPLKDEVKLFVDMYVGSNDAF